MEIRKKVNEVKEKVKNLIGENKVEIQVIGCGCLMLFVGYLRGRYVESRAMNGLKDLWSDMPYNVDYDIKRIGTDSSGLMHPFYFLIAENDRVMLEKKYGITQMK